MPIVQAPLGNCDGPRLAAAVSRAGALGCFSLYAPPEPLLRRRLAIIKAATLRPVLLALTAEWERETVVDICLEAGFRHFQLFWWNGPRLARKLRRLGATVFWQVGTLDQATEALDCGAQVLVAQGTEAGGQVRSPLPLPVLLEELLASTGGAIPIVAGGGLADANDVATVLKAGASAAMLGTRFLLSPESQAEPRYKARLLQAQAEDLTLDTRMIGTWPCAPRRRLRTAFDEDVPALFAGSGLSRMRQLLPAAEIVQRLASHLPDGTNTTLPNVKQ